MPSSISGSTPIEDPANTEKYRSSDDTARAPAPCQDEKISPVEARRRRRKRSLFFNLRGTVNEDDGEQDWWFASTAIPLLAATLGPLANVLSIAALVTSWRMSLVPVTGSTDSADLLGDLEGNPFADPRWCYWLNVVSLIVGFIGQIFLFCNFTSTIRYIIALPMTIFLWYVATGILIGITVSMEIHVPPNRPTETYSQGFWYAVIAAVLYFICSMLLMANMLGYFLGHYKQEFALTDDQRNLILQTYLFFIWLAGGGAVFSALETRYGTVPWSFVDGLYFCDVTILTVGFGDLTPTDNIGRGIVFPYSVGGIIMLGLVISSISNFTGELGQDNIVKGHVQRARIRTIGRTVTSSSELEERTRAQVRIPAPPSPERRRSSIYSRFKERNRTLHYADENGGALAADRISKPTNPVRQGTFKKTFKRINTPRIRKPKLILMREERDRFNAMREIQRSTAQFKRWASLSMSALAFGVLWCVGAVVFWKVERGHQEMDYFQALYFCYVSLLTIGYGDFAPKSNAGRPFFIVWSLIAVPTMTVLISHMGDTVISSFKQGTVTVADWTLLPKKGLFRAFLERNPWLMNWIIKKKEKKEANKRVEEGFQTGLDETDTQPCRTIDALASEQLTEHALARKLAYAIRDTAGDLKLDKQKRYSYEDWVEFTRLIRFTSKHGGNNFSDEEEEGLIDWDWIGEESPMMSGQTEAEFVLDRLCESMTRYIRHQIVAKNIERRESNGGETNSEETRGQGDSEKNLELQ